MKKQQVKMIRNEIQVLNQDSYHLTHSYKEQFRAHRISTLHPRGSVCVCVCVCVCVWGGGGGGGHINFGER